MACVYVPFWTPQSKQTKSLFQEEEVLGNLDPSILCSALLKSQRGSAWVQWVRHIGPFWGHLWVPKPTVWGDFNFPFVLWIPRTPLHSDCIFTIKKICFTGFPIALYIYAFVENYHDIILKCAHVYLHPCKCSLNPMGRVWGNCHFKYL